MEDDEDQDDMHMCLVCNQTIIGLMNYVTHKKSQCQGRKMAAVQTTVALPILPERTSSAVFTESINPMFDTAQNILPLSAQRKTQDTTENFSLAGSQSFNTSPSAGHLKFPVSSSQMTYMAGDHMTSSYSVGRLQSTIPSTLTASRVDASVTDHSEEILASPNKKTDHVASEKVDDFFSSLELRSKTSLGTTAARQEVVQQGRNDLPISSILNSLTFSSDEDDLGFPFNEDVSLDGFSDDSDNWNPPMSHTGGKWKPGEAPTRGTRQHPSRGRPRGGKWRPGESTNQVTAKKIKASGRRGAQGGRGRSRAYIHKKKHSDTKTYQCNFCDVTFENRFLYSNHCGSKVHKERVFGQNSTLGTDRSEPSQGHSANTVVNYSQDTEQYRSESVQSRKYSQEREGEKDNEHKHLEEKEQERTEQGENNDVTSDNLEIGSQRSETCPSATLTSIPIKTLHICTICDKKYDNKFLMSRHLITRFHRNRSAGHPDALLLLQQYHRYIVRLSPFQCEVCQFYFNTKQTFDKHIQTETHLQNCSELIGELTCCLCSFKTHSHPEMEKHFESDGHRERLSKQNRLCILKESHVKVKCKYCDIVMESFTRLKRHVTSKHPTREKTTAAVRVKGGNNPVCPHCSKRCASLSALDLHVRRKHTKVKKHKCELCVKAFCDKYTLELHFKSTRHIQNVIDMTDEKPPPLPLSAKDCKPSTSNQTEEAGDVLNDDIDTLAPESLEIEPNTEIEEEASWRPNLKLKLTSTTKKRRKNSSSKDKAIKCNHCNFMASSYNDLRPHYLKVHSAAVKLCEICDLVFLSLRSLKLHYLSRVHQKNMSQNELDNVDTNYHQCKVCKKKFTDENYCKFHTEFMHNSLNSEDAVLKKFHGKDITRLKYADLLAKIEPLDKSERVECPDCSNSLKKINFIEHLRLHCGDRPFECRICRKGFISAVTLRRHLLGHFGCQERTCEICGKEYKKVSSYEQHMAVHQMEKAGEQKLHVCEVCGQSFFFDYQLHQHSRRHRERQFKCTVPGCHWKFVYKNELKYHMRSHNQDKPYLCDICGYAATTKTRLLRHNRTHTGERKYHCEYCTYKAGNSTHLHRHMRIHIGSKPYKCPYCDYSCNTHENIRKHITQTKKHEGMKIYPCKFCTYATNKCKDFRNHLLGEHEDEVGSQTLETLSVFTGLYKKDLDPKQPVEGTRIIQLKEKTPSSAKAKRSKKSSTSSEEKAVMYFNQDHGVMTLREHLQQETAGAADGDIDVPIETDGGHFINPLSSPTHLNHNQSPEHKTYASLETRQDYIIDTATVDNSRSYLVLPNLSSGSVPVAMMMSRFPSNQSGNTQIRPTDFSMHQASSMNPHPSHLNQHHQTGPSQLPRQLHSDDNQMMHMAHLQSSSHMSSHMSGRSLLSGQGGRFHSHGYKFGIHGSGQNISSHGNDEDERDLVIDMGYSENIQIGNT